MNNNENIKEKQKAIEFAMSNIRKQFGEGSIMLLGQSARMTTEIIKTGSIALDMAIGLGGIPKGRIVEIFGPESSGKTTLATHIVANAQKKGVAAFIDAEHALDPSYAEKIGVNLNDLLISQPDSGEEALNIVEMLARSNAVDVIVIDSVAALVPKCELEGNIGDTFMGVQARMMSQALRKLTATLSKTKTSAIFINQLREKIGIVFGNPEVTTGGRALKFYSSLRLDIRKIASLKNSDNKEFGTRVRVKVVKNKLAPPFRIAEFDILFNEGISHTGNVIDIALEFGIVEKKGSWFNYNGNKLGQGREFVRSELKKNKNMLIDIESKILQKIKDDIKKENEGK